MCRVVILENRTIVKEGLCSIIQKMDASIEVVDFCDIQSFVNTNMLDIDILMLDYALLFTDTKGIQGLRRLYPSVHLVGITNYVCERADTNLIEEMIYLNDNPERIKQIIERLIQLNKKYIVISDREKEILKLLSMGNNTKSIASQLHISPHTVSTHKRNILKKTHCKSVVELVSFSYEEGIL